MLTLLKVFGPSPFAPLQLHMQKVAKCIDTLTPLFAALHKGAYEEVEALSETISQLEHQADEAKDHIRNHMTRGLFLRIDKRDLLDILTLQDQLADKAEDISVLTTLRTLQMPKEFYAPFMQFLEKNQECFQGVFQVIQELDELLESAFGGQEAEKVKEMIEQVSRKEYEADLLQIMLLKQLFNYEGFSTPIFSLWLKIFQEIGTLSNFSETLANRIRMLLEIK